VAGGRAAARRVPSSRKKDIRMMRFGAILGVMLGLACAAPPASAFPPPGPWDGAAFDSPARPSARQGAAIAAARALANARAAEAREGTERQRGPVVARSCSLDIASLTTGRAPSNSTIVLEADIRAPIIQICR
jgi:hypothetical protein